MVITPRLTAFTKRDVVGRTICTMRRFLRVAYSGWRPFNPEKVTPAELGFIILDAEGTSIGELRYLTYKTAKKSVLDTPWGQANVSVKDRWKTIERIEVEGRLVADYHFSPLKNDLIFYFPNDVTLKFDAQFIRDDMKHTGPDGTIEVNEREGRIESRHRGDDPYRRDGHASSNEQLRTYESDRYREWKLTLEGIVPVDELSLQKALLIYLSGLELVRETFDSTPPAR